MEPLGRILVVVDDVAADLIVIGTRSDRGIKRVVLVVPPPTAAAAAA